MSKSNIGMVGLAVMGSNLARNMANHGFKVSCWNYTPDLTEKFFNGAAKGNDNLVPFYDLKEFVDSLYKHTKDRENDYAEDMAYRFLQKIKKIKAKTYN